MAMTVPPEVVAALAGSPEVGAWEPMFPLLTVDESGFPHVCLLSRAELDSDLHHVYAVLASPTTVTNLSRRPAATLMVIVDDCAYYLKLGVIHVSGSGLQAVVFEVISSVSDSLAIPLTPPRYLVASSLPVAEAWARSAELLSSLTGRNGGSGSGEAHRHGAEVVEVGGDMVAGLDADRLGDAAGHDEGPGRD
jgi:hypothetical protein